MRQSQFWTSFLGSCLYDVKARIPWGTEEALFYAVVRLLVLFMWQLSFILKYLRRGIPMTRRKSLLRIAIKNTIPIWLLKWISPSGPYFDYYIEGKGVHKFNTNLALLSRSLSRPWNEHEWQNCMSEMDAVNWGRFLVHLTRMNGVHVHHAIL